jgi:glycosyltransferase involved in cell wall biosynthesis
MVGKGNMRQPLEDIANALGLGGRVKFAGFRTDISEVLSCMDIFVMPSIIEGFSLSILEAMASGLPVVASHVGGISEVVKDGVTGILVKPRAKKELAEALTCLLKDTEKRRNMGTLGKDRFLNLFSSKIMLKNTDHLYKKYAETKLGR